MTDHVADGQSARPDLDESDILPCPFCGKAPFVEPTGFHLGGRTIRCETEDCMGPHTTAACVSDAVAQWNTRPVTAPVGLELTAWKDGRLSPCTIDEFVRQLYRYSGYADEQFKFNSDPSAHLGERLKMAADAILALSRPPENVDHRATEPAALRSAGGSDKTAAWIAFAGNGNIRFWTADPTRAANEKERGMDLRAFTLAELVALAAKPHIAGQSDNDLTEQEIESGATEMRLDATTAELERLHGFTKELSDALLKVRPLGGSELFVRRFGRHYADPAYCGAAIEQMHARLHEALKDAARARKAAAPSTPVVSVDEWQDIATAQKDGTPILVRLKNPLPEPNRTDLDRWHGVTFVARHNGLARDGFDVGWQFAAPVGQGGFPDRWIEGWMPVPGCRCPADSAERQP